MSEVKKYNAYAEGLTVHFELDSEGAWVAASDFDAERLRADTAEADSARKDRVIEDMIQSNSDMTTCLAAAEQRIADLYSTSAIDAAAKKLAECMNYPWEHMPEKGRASMRDHAKSIIDAALNPNPEAEIHE